VRRGFVEQRTATINRLRGLLSEFGIVLAQKAVTVRREAALNATPRLKREDAGNDDQGRSGPEERQGSGGNALNDGWCTATILRKRAAVIALVQSPD
jgi:transposase